MGVSALYSAARTYHAAGLGVVMRKFFTACFAMLCVLQANAAGTGLKPGLWEIRVVKQVMDGRDRSEEIAAAKERMQQSMANMPPAQRAQMESMLKQHGMGQANDGSFRVCISPEMAKRDHPVIDRDGRCQPAKVSHNGNVTTFEFSCASGGSTRTGKGEMTVSGNSATSKTDMTTNGPQGVTHQMHSESEMKYLGADCGDIKPMEVPKDSH